MKILYVHIIVVLTVMGVMVMMLFSFLGLAAFPKAIMSGDTKLDIAVVKDLDDELSGPRFAVYNVSGFFSAYNSGSIDHSKITVILRHDIDNCIPCSREVFLIDSAHNLTSTFYFLPDSSSYNLIDPATLGFINMLSSKGFEVGLHYDELYQNGYNASAAIIQFQHDLLALRTYASVTSVASHGNTVNQKYINYDMFNLTGTKPREFGVYEAYLSVSAVAGNFTSYHYISDTRTANNPNGKINVTSLETLPSGSLVQILIHPEHYGSALSIHS